MVRVAVTQHEPVWLDLAATVEKTCVLIDEAAANEAKLVAFPEVWITGYPTWIWSRPMDPPLATTYIKNSLSYDSLEMHKICESAKRSKIAVVLGFSENDGNSLYIAQCIISAAGEIIMKRRKFKPTHMERTVFGDAGGKSLFNVADVDGLGKVGALSCWEHSQPLLKYHTMSQREQIHVAAWPPLKNHEGAESHFAMSSEGCQVLSQTYAIESAAFVLHCTSVMKSGAIKMMKTSDSPLFGQVGGGYSAIYGPDGRRISDPIPPDQEGFVYGDLPLDLILTVRHFVDACGHYSRPELLWLGVDGREKPHVRTILDKEGDVEREL